MYLYSQHIFILASYPLPSAGSSVNAKNYIKLRTVLHLVLGSALLPPTQRLHREVLIRHKNYFTFALPRVLFN